MPPSSSDPTATLREFLESVSNQIQLSADSKSSLDILDRAKHEIQRFAEDEEYKLGQSFLDAYTNFNKGLLCVQNANFVTGAECMEKAAKDFAEVGIEGLSSLSVALHSYYAGVVELQHQNLTKALELMHNAEVLLSNTEGDTSTFRMMIDHMMPDQLFAAAVVAIMNRDITKGQVLIANAADKSESVAASYYGEEDPTRFLFLGLAKFYRAFLDMFKLWSDFGKLDLEEAAQMEDAGRLAREAAELLAKTDPHNHIAQNCRRIAITFEILLDSLQKIIRVVRAMMTRQPIPNTDFTALRNRIKEAESNAAAGGEQNLIYVRICQDMSGMVQNVARLVPETYKNGGLVRVFVMMPFSEESKAVEDGLRLVLENDPYWFQIILARDLTLRKNLFENVKAHMDVVDAFVAEISDLNPNVMLELGMTENDPQRRPVFVLRRGESKDPPTDLKGRLYIEYNLAAVDNKNRVQELAEQLRQSFKAVDDMKQLIHRRRGRYLSLSYIANESSRNRLVLENEEARRLQQEFASIEELQAANAELIASKTGFGMKLARMIAEIFGAKSKAAIRRTG